MSTPSRGAGPEPGTRCGHGSRRRPRAEPIRSSPWSRRPASNRPVTGRTTSPASGEVAPWPRATVCWPKWKIDAASTALGAAGGDALVEVLERADAAARDDRDVDRVAHRLQQLDVVAGLGAVAVHRREQDLARAEVARRARPTRPRRARSACARRASRPPSRAVVGVAARRRSRRRCTARRTRRRRRARCSGSFDRRGVERHLVGAGAQHACARPRRCARRRRR